MITLSNGNSYAAGGSADTGTKNPHLAALFARMARSVQSRPA